MRDCAIYYFERTAANLAALDTLQWRTLSEDLGARRRGAGRGLDAEPLTPLAELVLATQALQHSGVGCRGIRVCSLNEGEVEEVPPPLRRVGVSGVQAVSL